jgi:uncharacterized protein (DUF2237 family)
VSVGSRHSRPEPFNLQEIVVSETRPAVLNVLGTPLESCCSEPRTGFYRDGFCHTGPLDNGSHTVCACVSAQFLEFSKRNGNDLSTPRPEFDFPGLKPGDKWCLCVSRWEEAFIAGVAPPVVLESTHQRALEVVDLAELKAHAMAAS